MTAHGLFNVTRKEFTDHLTSRRFLVILALFLVISTMGLYEGIKNYNQQLESYAEQMQSLPSGDVVDRWMPEKPSILSIFFSLSSQIGSLGAILAIAMGFDLVSREKETRSLKSLLSHPVFRDEIINGKAFGGVLALVFAMGAAFVIALAVLLVFSIVPGINELGAILIFGVVSVVYLLSFFAVALLMSTISNESGNALIYSLIIFFTLAMLMSTVGGTVATIMVGDPPEPPESPYPIGRVVPLPIAGENTKVEVAEGPVITPEDQGEWKEYEEESRAYWERRMVITDAFNLASPQMNYMTISMAIVYPRMGIMSSVSSYSYGIATDASGLSGDEVPGLFEVLGSLWKNIVALFVFPAIFFTIAYVKFMRMDVR